MSNTRLNRETYEVCGFCDRFAPSSTMETIYARDAHGERVRIRICARCRSPTLTYIQSAAGWPQRWPHSDADVANILAGALAVTIIALGVFFGLVIGSASGFAVMIACSLLGAGILAAVAVSCIQS